MKTITYQNHRIIGVHILTRTVDGNPTVPYSVKQYPTLITSNYQTISVSACEYERFVVGSGIAKFTGSVLTGGGRHAFYGIDLAEAVDHLRQMLARALPVLS
jgi:hypothetical protein